MKNSMLSLATLGLASICMAASAWADNPLFLDQFSADPTARVFDGKIFLFNSHDIPSPPGFRPNWFCMADYHVHSSENLLDWQDHGVIVTQEKVNWVNATTYSMWAPDCVFKNGKYYFYFPAQSKAVIPTTAPATSTAPAASTATSTSPATAPATAPGARGRGARGGGGGGFRIGVAIADKPEGPYVTQPLPIAGTSGIDPCILLDKDGSAYMYTAQGRFSVAKLKPNMLEIDSAPQVLQGFPTQGQIEGPFIFERNGIYYVTYPHVAKNTERLEYAMAKSPMGPFTVTGVIMDESASGCWTNQDSIVQYKDSWYIFYHDKDLSPETDKLRAVRADYLHFNEDGTIQKVIPTLRGIGVADAKRQIQIDRYSAVSKEGAVSAYLDDKKPTGGWKVSLTEKDAFVQYDHVDFAKYDLKSVKVRANSTTGGSIEIHVDKGDGPLVAKVNIPTGADWSEISAKLTSVPSGVHDLVVTMPQKNDVAIDWVSFE